MTGARPKIVVGTGWWSDHRPHPWTIGTRRTRTPEFFEIWYALVIRYLNPHRIVVTDSHSPLKPRYRDKPEVTWIELDDNYGHANDIRVGRVRTKHSGFTRSVFLGAAYALACDADYYVYVEQDCVVHGDGLLDAITASMEHPISLGAPTVGGTGIAGPAAPMLQQSLMVVRKDGLERFVAGILLATESDGDMPPEIKFERALEPFNLIPIPFGRSRPLDLSVPHFYAQHLTEAELDTFVRMEPAIAGSRRASPASTVTGRLHTLCAEYPALRDVLLTVKRRRDLREAFPEVTEGRVERLLRWALVRGAHEEPVLAELAPEIAALCAHGDRLREPLPAASPAKVHVVTLAGFPESFHTCARALHQALRRASIATDYLENLPRAELPSLTRMPADEIVHIAGQTAVTELCRSAARNWCLTIHGAASYALPPDLHAPPDSALEELRAHAHLVPHVICGSFAARREIAIAYGLSPEAIDPVSHFFDTSALTPDGPRHHGPSPYFLVVSSYQPKKNYVAVLEAMQLLVAERSASPSLLIAGKINQPLVRLLDDAFARWPVLKHRVVALGHIEDLTPLYRGALALVSMSHHEGFGMPPIEAALCGVPVIGPGRSPRAVAWASQPTRELLGGAAIVVEPDQPAQLAAVMRMLAEDPTLREDLGRRCLGRATELVDPVFLLSRYLRVYGKVLARSARA